MQTASLENRAGFWVRFAAFLMDRLILWVLLLFVRIPGLFSSGGFYSRAVLFRFTAMDILSWALISLYFVILTALGGATLGKLALGLRVVSDKGEAPSFLTVLYRETVGRYLSGILCIGYILIAADPEKRALHDRICDTLVVYSRRTTPEEPAPSSPPERVLTLVPVEDPVKDWYAPYRK